MIDEPGELVAKVGLPERVDPSNAPRPSNESERLLFRQLYETLVRVDCRGNVLPALAESWRIDVDGRKWIVTLREDARFSDGARVTAADVVASWSRSAAADELRPYVARLVQSVATVDTRVLAITLQGMNTDAPLPFAHTDLAIARRVADSHWPLGTRSSRVVEEHRGTGTTASQIVLERDNLPPIQFLAAPSDSRDLLDDEVDLLLTRDPATLAYAATLTRFQSLPLEWYRMHVLLTPGRTGTAPVLSGDARQVLARDAVRGEARGAEGPFWLQTLPDCEAGNAPPPKRPSSRAPRIVYDASDGAARDLAERLVGLAGNPISAIPSLDPLLPLSPGRPYRATGLGGDALARAVRLGTDAAYIVALDRRPVDPCGALRELMERARWLDPQTIEPLVDTRPQAILQRGRSGITVEWDGGVILAPASRRTQP